MRVLALLALVVLLPAGCGGDDRTGRQSAATPAPEPTAATSTPTPTPTPTPAPPSDPELIAQVGNQWAPLFAAGDPALCDFLTGPAFKACALGVYAGARPTRLQRSFEGATVEDVRVEGERGAARFSNGVHVELERVVADSGEVTWRISDLGEEAGRALFQ